LLGIAAFSRHTSGSAARPRSPVFGMSDLHITVPKVDRALMARRRPPAAPDPKQRKLMVGSLCLLLLALGIVLWRNRDFWFPGSQEETQEAELDQPLESSPAAGVAPAQPAMASTKPAIKARTKTKAKHHVASAAKAAAPAPAPTTPPPAVETTRTVLPPLEVEVVAGDTHRKIRPGSSSVRVDLQPGAPPQPVTEAAVTRNRNEDTETAAKVTTEAAERVEMSAGTSDIVTTPVRPNYPLLARQMKVQGSVILQALISKDGVIQNLKVVSGPHILAGAAQDAVRQWHFKPHVVGNEAVETQAKITVNFTISTN
jgi:periplasmic protein TonB